MGQMDNFNFRIDNPTVEAVGKMNFSGNIIPNSWFRTLCDKSGHPYMNAIVLLADIRYWYTPTEIRDEESGRTIGFRKKFKADALQRSRNKFSEQFGLSLKQVDAALDYLQECGIIKKEIRSGVVFNGRKAGNTMYILLDAEALYRYTYPDKNDSSKTVKKTNEEMEKDFPETGNEEETVSQQGKGVSPYRGRGYPFAGSEDITIPPLQGKEVSPSRERGYPPIGREGIPLQGERVSPYRGRHTYNNTYINTENKHLHSSLQKKEDDRGEDIREVFTELCGNVEGMKMTKDNCHDLADCIRRHPEMRHDVILLAAKFSSATCLSKSSSSKIKYLTAVLSTLEERKINTPDKFQQFQLEYRKRKQKEWDCSMEFQREYDFAQLERQLLSNIGEEELK